MSIINTAPGISTNQLNTVFNVVTYGAIGDDSTNNTTAIQNAINACEANGGGIVYFPEGIYQTNPLTIDSDYVILQGVGRSSQVKLIGQNLTTLGDHSIIQFLGTSGDTLANVGIELLSVNGNKANMTGVATLNMECIAFDYVRNGFVRACYVINGVAEGIDLDNSESCMVINNHVYDCDGSGIHVSNGSLRNLIEGNYVQGNGDVWLRRGIDQYGTAQYNLYVGNMARSNYQNYDIDGAGQGMFYANQSLGTVTLGDTFPDETPHYAIGTIAAATINTTGNKSVTGVGFHPRLVEFTLLPTSSAATGSGGTGAMDAEGNQFAQAFTGTSRNANTTSCMMRIASGSSVILLASTFVSMDDDGFTFNVGTTSGAEFPIAWKAYY